MSEAYQEGLINPSEPEVLSREELAGSLGYALGAVIEAARQKNDLVDMQGLDTSKSVVKRPIRNLIKRSTVLVENIDYDTDPSGILAFDKYLKAYTDSMLVSVDLVGDRFRLAEVLDRYGMGLQTNLATNHMLNLSEEAKKVLEELDKDELSPAS